MLSRILTVSMPGNSKALTLSGNVEQLNVIDYRTNIFWMLISHTIGNIKVIKYSDHFLVWILWSSLAHIHLHIHTQTHTHTNKQSPRKQ